MASTSGGTIVCPDCGVTYKSLSRHKGSQKCLTNQATRPNQPYLAAVPPFTPLNAPVDLSMKLRELRQSNQLMRRVPKSARYTAAVSLISDLDEIINGGGATAWKHLLTFAFRAFSLPATKDKRTVSLTTIVKQNLARTSDFVTVRDAPKRPPPKPTASKSQKAVAQKMNDCDVSGAVRLLSSEDALALPSQEVLNVLKSKHPPANPNCVYPPAPCDTEAVPPSITAKEVLEAIASFPNGSAGGLDGLLPQHLKDLVSSRVGDIKDRLVYRLAIVLTAMLNGEVPAEVCPLLYGGALTALNKKDGGIRPIACGNTLRRLIGKIISRRVMSAMGELVRPKQLGYGTSGGAESFMPPVLFWRRMERRKCC